MSYEGYSQLICKKGHHWTVDCNIVAEETQKNKCPFCKGKAIWENMVNLTNGSYDEETGKRIDGYILLKPKRKISGICSCCGKEHVCEMLYNIPKKKR